MALTWADVVAVAPELSTTPVGSQTALLAYATAQCDVDAWGDFLNNGIVYLAAHLATLARRGGAAGGLTAESVGQLSRSYAGTIANQGALGTTAYGAEYRRLARLLPSALGVVF